MEDKDIIPPVPDEEQDLPVSEDAADVFSGEIDEDDAVHSLNPKPTEENMQQDADDAVHKNYKPAVDPLHQNEERDPDDVIHGN